MAIGAAVLAVGVFVGLGVMGVTTAGSDRAVTSVNTEFGGSVHQVGRPVTGAPQILTTPEGDRYRVAAVRAGWAESPVAGMPQAPPGAGYPFIDYVLANALSRPVPLEFPVNLFLRRDLVPPDFTGRCVNRVGARPALCDLPGRSRVIGRLPGSPSTLVTEADTYLPPGGSYLIRTVADAPVEPGPGKDDMALYVWEVRYTRDQIARLIPFPASP